MARATFFSCLAAALLVAGAALLSIPIDAALALIEAAPVAFSMLVTAGFLGAGVMLFAGLTRHQVLALVQSRERVRNDAFQMEILSAA